MPFFWIEALGELHRVRDVGEEDGHGLALAFKRAFGGENFVDEMAWRVGAWLGASDAWGAPQALQNLASGGFSCPQDEQLMEAHLS
jgi:hypothetical protein